jgi:hypothetical protein
MRTRDWVFQNLDKGGVEDSYTTEIITVIYVTLRNGQREKGGHFEEI